MKIRHISTLLILVFATSVLCACGAKEKEAVLVSDIITSTDDIPEVVAADADSSADEAAPVTVVAASEPSSDEVTTDETAEVAVESEETTEAEPTIEDLESTDTITPFTYTDMNQTMYVKSNINVRDLPDTYGEKLGLLTGNEAITVTGKCNETGWYRIDYKGSTGYVSNDYIREDNPLN